jgi:ankyrin repeat protein
MSEDDLVAAALTGKAGRVGQLLDSGVSPDEPDGDGGTPLYGAAVQGNAEIVRMLLAAGADPGRESGGESQGLPLCAAACWGHLDVVIALLDYGADPELADAQGRRPIDLARWHAGQDIEAEVRARAAERAPRGAQITVRREESEGGGTRIVAEVRDNAGDLRSESHLGTGHTEIVRLLEARVGGQAGPAA